MSNTDWLADLSASFDDTDNAPPVPPVAAPSVQVPPAASAPPPVTAPTGPKVKSGSSGKAKGTPKSGAKKGGKKSKKKSEPESLPRRFIAYWKGFAQADGAKGKIAHLMGGLLWVVLTVGLALVASAIVILVVKIIFSFFRDRFVANGWHGFLTPGAHAFYLVLVAIAALCFGAAAITWGFTQRKADRTAKADWKARRKKAIAEIKALKKNNQDVPDSLQDVADSPEPVIKVHWNWAYLLIGVVLVTIFLAAVPYRAYEDICQANHQKSGTEALDRGCYTGILKLYNASTSPDDKRQLARQLAYVAHDIGVQYGKAPVLPAGADDGS